MLNETPIYLNTDQAAWNYEVQRKIGQIYCYVAMTSKEHNHEVLSTLEIFANGFTKLSGVDEQIKARMELAGIIDNVMEMLARYYQGLDRVGFDSGIMIIRISLCAHVAATMQEPSISSYEEKILQIYRAELQRTAICLRDSIPISQLAPNLFTQVCALIDLALDEEHFVQTHELAEQIMKNTGYFSLGPLPSQVTATDSVSK